MIRNICNKIDYFICLLTVFKLMMENCFRDVQNIRKNVYDIIISPIYHKIKAEKQLHGFAVHLFCRIEKSDEGCVLIEK